MRLVKGLASEAGARVCVAARAAARFTSVQDLAERARLNAKDLGALASAGALATLASNRHRARWEVAGVEQPTALLERVRFAEALPILRRPTEGEDIAADYRHVGVSLGRHPLTLLQAQARGGRHQDGPRAWPIWRRARAFARQGSSSRGNGRRAHPGSPSSRSRTRRAI